MHGTPPAADSGSSSSRAIASKSSRALERLDGAAGHSLVEPDAPGGEKALAPAVRQTAAQRHRALIVLHRFLGRRAQRDLLGDAQAEANTQFEADRDRRVSGMASTSRSAHWHNARSIPSWRSGAGRARRRGASIRSPSRSGRPARIAAPALRASCRRFREALFHDQRDGRMQLLAARAQHGRIGGVLDQRMLERYRRRSAACRAVNTSSASVSRISASCSTASGSPATAASTS